MTGGRLVRLAGVGIAGIVGGFLLAVAVLTGIFFLIVGLTQESPATRARKDAQSFFDVNGRRTATVKSCTKIGSDEEAFIYRCQIVAPGCTRAHRFVVYRDRMYGASLYSAAAGIADHPCIAPSD